MSHLYIASASMIMSLGQEDKLQRASKTPKEAQTDASDFHQVGVAAKYKITNHLFSKEYLRLLAQ
jgi:hypothetical protein